MKETGNGNCFETAAKVILDMHGDDDADRAIQLLSLLSGVSDMVVCHGKVSRPVDGFRHTHAWVEFSYDGDIMVIDTSNGKTYFGQVDPYRTLGQINDEETYIYSATDVRDCLLVHEVWGPWEDELMNLKHYKATGT